jgi:hypothetical protein
MDEILWRSIAALEQPVVAHIGQQDVQFGQKNRQIDLLSVTTMLCSLRTAMMSSNKGK